MRNLANASQRELDEATETTTRPIPRQVRPLPERQYTRLVREAGRKQTALHLRVARAMKAQEVKA